MKKYKCSKCKKLFNEKDIVKYAKTIYKGITHQYYRCNPCNTRKLQDFRKTDFGKKSTTLAVKNSIKKYKYKQDARQIVHRAILNGIIVKPKKCEVCNLNKTVEGHHFDYTKPLQLLWCCRGCHFAIHKKKKLV